MGILSLNLDFLYKKFFTANTQWTDFNHKKIRNVKIALTTSASAATSPSSSSAPHSTHAVSLGGSTFHVNLPQQTYVKRTEIVFSYVLVASLHAQPEIKSDLVDGCVICIQSLAGTWILMQEKIRIEKIYKCKLLPNWPSISFS